MSSVQAQWTCKEQIPIRYILNKKDVYKKMDICRWSGLNNKWINQKCYNKRGHCFKRIRDRSKNVQQKKFPFGNPYFQRCALLGGSPMLMEYKWEKNWQRSSLCQFENGDIVSITALP